MEKNLRRDPVIGFLDSGIGGLTVLYEARQRCPNARYLYYADTDHVPYGTKSREEIRRYVVDAVTFLVKHGVDILVIACNTATSMAVEELRSRFPLAIIGMEPAVRPAISGSQNSRMRDAGDDPWRKAPSSPRCTPRGSIGHDPHSHPTPCDLCGSWRICA